VEGDQKNAHRKEGGASIEEEKTLSLQVCYRLAHRLRWQEKFKKEPWKMGVQRRDIRKVNGREGGVI